MPQPIGKVDKFNREPFLCQKNNKNIKKGKK